MLSERGYDDLSLRDVAASAGVTHTTAYSYFSSKDHLIAEIFLRLLRDAPASEPQPNAPLADRLEAALRSAAVAVGDDHAVAHGILAAVVSEDPDTVRVRNAIGVEVASRITRALGSDVDGIADGVLLMFSGAMLQAGLGYFAFDEVVDRVKAAATLWAPKRRAR